MADADSKPPEVGRAELPGNVAKAVVAGDAAAEFHLRFTGKEIELVVHDEDLLGCDREKARHAGNGPPRQIHEGLGLEQPQVARRLRHLRLELALAAEGETEPRGERVDKPEPGVVPRAGVLPARIAQTRDETDGGHRLSARQQR